MKRVCWLLVGLAWAGSVVPALAQRVLHVQVRSTPLRQSPSFLGAPLADLQYGDRVQPEREQGSWVQVRADGETVGWVHGSALTRQRVRLIAGEEDAAVTATGDEIAIAGKGFNEQVESEFKAGGSPADYTWVDRAEQRAISPEDIRRFMVSGGLQDPSRGGAQ